MFCLTYLLLLQFLLSKGLTLTILTWTISVLAWKWAFMVLFLLIAHVLGMYSSTQLHLSHITNCDFQWRQRPVDIQDSGESKFSLLSQRCPPSISAPAITWYTSWLSSEQTLSAIHAYIISSTWMGISSLYYLLEECLLLKTSSYTVMYPLIMWTAASFFCHYAVIVDYTGLDGVGQSPSMASWSEQGTQKTWDACGCCWDSVELCFTKSMFFFYTWEECTLK